MEVTAISCHFTTTKIKVTKQTNISPHPLHLHSQLGEPPKNEWWTFPEAR